MDLNIQRFLNDKLYDKRKIGALEYVFFFPFLPFFIAAFLHFANPWIDMALAPGSAGQSSHGFDLFVDALHRLRS